MKYSIVFTLFFGLFLKSSPAQTYTPFPDSNAVWNVLEFYPLGSSFSWSDSIWNSTMHYGLFGDTLINSMNYHKLFYNNGLMDSTIVLSNTNTTYCGAIREEVPAKKIFYLPKDSVNESLLYNFNLNLHDTIIINWNTFICNGINSVLINSHYRKIFHLWSFTTLTGDLWIEGIGSSNGLLYTFYYPIFDTIKYGLLCFHHNDTLEYHMDGSLNYWPIPASLYDSGCYHQELYITTNIHENENILNPNVIIYPNPVTDKSILKIPDNFSQENTLIEIFDLQGRKIKEYQKINSHQLTLYRADFNVGGVYFVRIKSDKFLETIKLVVQ